MPLAGKNKADRARAHLQWADRYSRYGDTHKAAAHFGRALEYDRRQAFGVVEEVDERERVPAAANRAPEKQQVSRIDELPYQLKWKILTQDGCDRAIEETRDVSIETRQGLYDTQMTKDIDRSSLFVPEQCRLASGLDEQHPNFTYRCSRFFQNCAERDGRSDARVMNLTDVTIREVLAQHRTAITNGTFYPPIGEWNVSRVTNMKDLFRGWAEFNSLLEKWDTSNVVDMASMFADCRDFNQPIGNWDTSRVTRMSRMFNGAVAFNQPIGNWKTGRVQIMNTMFRGAVAFQQDISSWDVSSVRTAFAMFLDRAPLPAHMRPLLTPEQINDQ